MWWSVLVLWAAIVAGWLGCRDDWPASLTLPDPEAWSKIETIEMGRREGAGVEVRRLGEGKLPQPEDVVAAPDGSFYVTCADGWIRCLHLTSEGIAVFPWAQIPSPLAAERPLGLALGGYTPPFHLIVAHPHFGLLNVTPDSVEVLVDEAACLKFKLTDAVAVSREGLIYFTDASYKYSLEHHEQDIIEARPNGRLLMYDPTTRATTVLMDALWFANGVALSADQTFLVVCETTLARCLRYWLKGDKAGRAEVFIDNLPAYPDNIKNDEKGHFWIGLVSTRSSLLNALHKYPLLKGLMWRLMPKKLLGMPHKRAMVLCVTEDGRPLFSLVDPKGSAIGFVTTALLVDGHLYLGNLAHDFLGRINLADIPSIATYFQK